jgi:predicted flap endonuclease-1-like 5' DNA nuclease
VTALQLLAILLSVASVFYFVGRAWWRNAPSPMAKPRFDPVLACGEAANAAPRADDEELPDPAPPVARASVEAIPRASTGDALAYPIISSRAASAGPMPSSFDSTAATAGVAALARRDDLLRILGVTQEFATLLAREGVLRYSQIAHWSPAEVRRFEELLGVPGLIARENWVEQALILSRGGDTAFSRVYDRRTRSAAVPASIPAVPGRL